MADDRLYLDVIPKIRVYEKKLLDGAKYGRMIDAADVDYAFKVLSETSYGENVVDDVNIYNYESVLLLEFEKLFKIIKDIFDGDSLIDIFLKKYRYNNIKLMLKSKFLGLDRVDNLFNMDGLDNDLIYNLIKAESFSLIGNDISDLIKRVHNDFEENGNPQRIDILIDREMFSRLLKESKEIGDDFLCNYIQISIDVFNTKALFRIRKMNLGGLLLDEVIVPGGNVPLSFFRSCLADPKENVLNRFSVTSMYKYIKDGLEHYLNNDDLGVLDKELDNYTMQYLRNAKIITTGLAPIIGYINAKESEIKNIRIILVGKINGVNPDSIRRRLREGYV